MRPAPLQATAGRAGPGATAEPATAGWAVCGDENRRRETEKVGFCLIFLGTCPNDDTTPFTPHPPLYRIEPLQQRQQHGGIVAGRQRPAPRTQDRRVGLIGARGRRFSSFKYDRSIPHSPPTHRNGLCCQTQHATLCAPVECSSWGARFAREQRVPGLAQRSQSLFRSRVHFMSLRWVVS